MTAYSIFSPSLEMSNSYFSCGKKSGLIPGESVKNTVLTKGVNKNCTLVFWGFHFFICFWLNKSREHKHCLMCSFSRCRYLQVQILEEMSCGCYSSCHYTINRYPQAYSSTGMNLVVLLFTMMTDCSNVFPFGNIILVDDCFPQYSIFGKDI